MAKKPKEFACGGRPPEPTSTSTAEEGPKTSQHDNKDLLPEIKLNVEEEAENDEDRIKAEYMEARERMAREIIAIEMKEKLAKEATSKEREANDVVTKEVVPKKRVMLEKAVKENTSEIVSKNEKISETSAAEFTPSSEDPDEEGLEDEDIVRDEDFIVNEYIQQNTASKNDLDTDQIIKDKEGEEKAQTSKASPRDVTEDPAAALDFDHLHHQRPEEERKPDYKESPVAKELAVLLSTVKDQYMTMLARMQAPSYSLRIQGEVPYLSCKTPPFNTYDMLSCGKSWADATN